MVNLNEPDRDDTNNQDFAEVTINNCLEVSQGFSPNEDLLNSYLTIPCIQDYPNNNLKIYNRLGVLIFESENYQNDWNGVPNRGFPKTNKILPVGTYFYVLQGQDIPEEKVGWIYLNY